MTDIYYRQYAALLKAAQGGSEEAFREIYQRTHKVQKYHLKQLLEKEEDVSDALQETYLLLYKNLDKIKPANVLLAYLNRLTFYVGKNFSKKKQRYAHRVSSFEWMEDMEEPDADPQEALERRETIKVLKEAIDKLEFRERQVIFMRYYQKMQHQEVALSLGISPTSAKRIQKSAHDHLREILHSQGIYGMKGAIVMLGLRRLNGKNGRHKKTNKSDTAFTAAQSGRLLLNSGRIAAVLGVSVAGVAMAISVSHTKPQTPSGGAERSAVSKKEATTSRIAAVSGEDVFLSLTFHEGERGLDYDLVYCMNSSGQIIYPSSINPDSHSVEFYLPHENLVLYYCDKGAAPKTLPVNYHGERADASPN